MSKAVAARTDIRAGADARRRRLPDVWQLMAHLILLVLTVAALAPFVWMVLGSFKTYPDLAQNYGLPRPWTIGNYREILSRANFARAFANSVAVAVPQVLTVCLTSAVIGYIFAKYRFPGRDLLFTMMLGTLMVPFAVTLVPLYVTLVDLKLVNKLPALVIVSVFSSFGTFLLRQTIRDIPTELIEAARIDGAGEVWIMRRIIIPLSQAPLAALAIFTFLGSWDDFLFPGIVLRSPELKTLPLVLAGLQSLYWSRYELFAAGSMLTVVPVMILYAFMQRHFVRGITLGGVKG